MTKLSTKFAHVSKRAVAVVSSVAIAIGGLVAGVAAPANAAPPAILAPKIGGSFGAGLNAVSMAAVGDYVYAVSGDSYGTAGVVGKTLYRASSANIAAAPVAVVPGSSSSSVCQTDATLGETVTALEYPGAVAAYGNSIYVMDCFQNYNIRLVKFDVSNTSATSLTGTVVATGSALSRRQNSSWTIGAGGVLYMGSSSSIYKITPDGNGNYVTASLATFGTLPSNKYVSSMAVDGSGLVHILASDYAQPRTARAIFYTLNASTGVVTEIARLAGDSMLSSDFTVNQTTGDISYIDNGAVYQITKGANSDYAENVLAVSKSTMVLKKVSHMELVGAPVNNVTTMEITTATPSGAAVGDKVSNHYYTGSSGVSWFNGATVSQVIDSTKFRVKYNGTLSTTTFTDNTVSVSVLQSISWPDTLVSTPNGIVLVDNHYDALATGHAQAYLVGTQTNSGPIVPPADAVYLSSGHRNLNITWTLPREIPDITGTEAQLWIGNTADAAVAAATAGGTPDLTCPTTSSSPTNSDHACQMYGGLQVGKFYAVRVKITSASGTSLSGAPTVPSSPNQQYKQVVAVSDSPMTATAVVDSPTGTGPGYAHLPAGGTGNAIELLRGSAPRIETPDANGGKFIAISSGNTKLTPYKIVHLNADGTIDTTFGTSGVMEFAGQHSSGTRSVSLSWFGANKFAFLDTATTNTGASYRLTSQDGSSTVTKAFVVQDLISQCSSAFTKDNQAMDVYINGVSLVSAATDSALVKVKCGMLYTSDINGSTSSNRLILPLLVNVASDNTLTTFSNPVGDLNRSDLVASGSKYCLNEGSNPIAPAPSTVAAGDTVVTLLYDASAATTSSSWCSNVGATGVAFQIATDGTATRTATGSTGTTSYSSYLRAGAGAFYLVSVSNGMTQGFNVNKLKADGTLDSTFGGSGTYALSGPACAGSVNTVLGVFNGTSGRQYITMLTKVSAQGVDKILPAAALVSAGTSSDRFGSTLMGVGVTMTNLPSIWSSPSNGGVVFSATSYDPATGQMSYSFFKNNTDGIARVTWDSFATALPAGDDPIECPALPFVSSTNSFAGRYSAGQATPIKLENGKIFIWGNSSYTGATVNKAEIVTPGNDPVEATIALSAAIPTTGGLNGYVMQSTAVGIGSNKVLIVGGNTQNGGQLKGMIYDAAADTFTATSGQLTKARCSALLQLLTNGKVLIVGGTNCAMGMLPPPVTYTDAEIFDPAAGTFTAVESDPGAKFSNIVSIGGGKHLLLGTQMTMNGQPDPASTATKVYNESSNAFTNGPALTTARYIPTVVPMSNGNIFVAGSMNMGMGPSTNGPPPSMTAEIYTPGANSAVGTFAAVRGNAMNSMTGASGIQLPSGKVMVLLGNANYGMASTMSVIYNPTTGNMSNGDERGAATASGIPVAVGNKIMIFGEALNNGFLAGSHFTVYTEPTEAAAAISSSAPRVLKGTTGNVTYTVSVPLTPGVVSGSVSKTSVEFANAAGSSALGVNAAVVKVNVSTKVVLSNNNLSVTVPLPTAAQAKNAGAVTVTIKSGASGTDIIGTTTLTYLATADVPAITSDTVASLNGVAGPDVATLPIGATSLLSPNQPGSGLTYTSATAAVCTVNATGLVTRVSRGTCTINVKQPKGLGNAEKTQAFTWVFAKTPQTITYAGANATTLPLTEDGTTLVASSSSQLALDFESTTDDICAIDDAGVLTTLALGTCTITIDQAGDATFAPATQVSRNITIQNPTQPPVDAPGAAIGDAVFGDTPAGDSMASVVATQRMSVAKNINLGRGLKVQYTPTIKAGKVTVIALNPTITSNYMGPITTVFSVPATLQAKAPAGWTKVGTNYNCTVTYGVSKKLAANARAKTVIYKPAKPCTLTATTQVPAGTVVTVKNTWDRRNAKTYVAITGGVQKRTARITLSAN